MVYRAKPCDGKDLRVFFLWVSFVKKNNLLESVTFGLEDCWGC